MPVPNNNKSRKTAKKSQAIVSSPKLSDKAKKIWSDLKARSKKAYDMLLAKMKPANPTKRLSKSKKSKKQH